MRDYTASLYTMLFELSRCYQGRLLGSTSPLTTEIQTAIDQTPNLFPSNVSVACQGVAGAYSQLACDKLFKLPHIMYFASFEAPPPPPSQPQAKRQKRDTTLKGWLAK